MLCTILKTFPFSRDGIHAEQATEGAMVDIPDSLVHGLEAEHYLVRGASAEAKAIAGAPENKMLAGAAENKMPEQVGVPLYSARDVGRGWFAIFKDGAEMDGVKKMRKDDADAFNAMTAEDRAEYVAAELANA